jgi:CBS domain-containing protein
LLEKFRVARLYLCGSWRGDRFSRTAKEPLESIRTSNSADDSSLEVLSTRRERRDYRSQTMQVCDVMTSEVRAIEPNCTVRDAARLMDELNVGILPVCRDRNLVGVITDRDIVIRSTAAGQAPGDQRVQEILTADVTTCQAEEDPRTVLGRMRQLQVRRMPVVDRDGQLIGLLSLGVMAAAGSADTGEALHDISFPAEPDRSGTPSSARADATRDARPGPLSADEQQELARRLAKPPEPRPDAGRAPDLDGTGRASHDEDDVRASFGIAASPAGGGSGRMPGGFGGDGYGGRFGPGEAQPRPATLNDDVNRIPGPDVALDGPVGGDG